jgi:gamma-glutamyltranspeptidase / glutathione hydrolase
MPLSSRRSSRRSGRRRGPLATFLYLALLAPACAPADDGPNVLPAALVDTAAAMVVTGNVHATRVGVAVLAAGGNAVDAAVATALTLGVVEPSQSGIGGRTQIVVGLPGGEVRGIDATTQIPWGYDAATAPRAERGWETVAIPGTVRGLARVLAEHGTWAWPEVLAPSIRLARDGFVLTPGEAERVADNTDVLAADPELAGIFLREDGAPRAAGDTVMNRALAATLETLAGEGPQSFYTGSLAARMLEALDARDGFVTADDLARYEAVDGIVGRGRYRGFELAGTWLPASGVTTIEILQILDHLDMAALGRPARTAALVQALLMGFRDREAAQGDAAEDAVAHLTDRALAAERAQAVRLPQPADSTIRGPVGGTGADEVRGGTPVGLPLAPDPVADHTTHLSVADENGMVVAMTQSLGPSWGSGVAVPGMGFPFAATLGGYLADLGPGGRAWSSQSPLLAFRDGAPALLIGGGGSRRIISAIVTTFHGIADDGLPLVEALAAARLHPTEEVVVLEAGRGAPWGEEVPTALEELGLEVELRETGTWFARLNAALRLPDGRWVGAADPRWPWGAAGGPGSSSSPR